MVNLVSPPVRPVIHYWQEVLDTDEPRLNRSTRQNLLQRRDIQQGLNWITASNGAVPRNAVKAGKSGNSVYYIGRACHHGSVTPGKIDPKRKACIIPWGGDANEKRQYEVLCTAGEFLDVTEENTDALLKACSAGISEYGEPLFVGRVYHDGKLIIGKVQQSHGVCYVAHEGKEVAFKQYQVFVVEPKPPFEGHYWVSNEGDNIPDNVYIGGVNETGPIYVGRAKHHGSFTPGSVYGGTCHLPWGGNDQPKPKFEYLCNCRGRFIASSKGRIPLGAVQGGYSELGEVLFIGRVVVNQNVIVGKVQPSHKVCYISLDGREVAYSNYEILVLQE